MTAVCSVGLDMICVPGDITPEIISGIIADEAAIGMVNSKTTAVRLIPAIGKKVGEELNFGGLLGCGPVMEVNTNSPAVFVNRGGRIPPPLQSLKTKKHKIQFFVHTILGEQSVLPLFSEDFLSSAFDFRHRSGAGKCKKEQSICWTSSL